MTTAIHFGFDGRRNKAMRFDAFKSLLALVFYGLLPITVGFILVYLVALTRCVWIIPLGLCLFILPIYGVLKKNEDSQAEDMDYKTFPTLEEQEKLIEHLYD